MPTPRVQIVKPTPRVQDTIPTPRVQATQLTIVKATTKPTQKEPTLTHVQNCATKSTMHEI